MSEQKRKPQPISPKLRLLVLEFGGWAVEYGRRDDVAPKYEAARDVLTSEIATLESENARLLQALEAKERDHTPNHTRSSSHSPA